MRSPLTFAGRCGGAGIETVEGLTAGDELQPALRAYHERHGLQRGFCTSGLLLVTTDLLERDPDAGETDAEVDRAR